MPEGESRERRATIALVEDDPALADLLQQMLCQLGYTVAGVARDEGGIAAFLTTSEPDLVLMDIQLAGGTDGIEAAKGIRSLLGLPVVFLTGHGDLHTIERAKDANPYGYILKPVSLRDLEVGIEIALNRHRLERRILESEHWLAATLDCLEDAVVTTDEQGRVRLANQAFLRICDQTTDRTIGQPVAEVLCCSSDSDPGTELPELCAASTAQVTELELLDRNGEGVPVELRVTPIIGTENRPIGRVLTMRDLTERKLAAQASTLRDYRELLEHAHDAVLVLAIDGTVLEANQHMRELYGFTPLEVEGLTLETLAKEPVQARKLIRTTLSAGSCRDVEMVHFRQDGTEMVVEVNAAHVQYRGRQAILAINRDVTERHRAELALQQSEEQLRRLAEHLQRAREQERIAVARAVHDELGQQLTALKLDLSWTRKRLAPDTGVVNDKMSAMIKLVDGAIETIQRIATNLRPSILDNLGLAAAMEWLVADMSNRSDIEINLEIEPPEPSIGSETSVVLFRLLQESLSNVIRHASASRVTVSLLCTEQQATLRIRDNGIGISEQAVGAGTSIGLVGMQERARSCGGSVEIQGFPGTGTTVTATLPLTRKETGALQGGSSP